MTGKRRRATRPEPAGAGCTVVRPQPDATWRIAADAWCLAACTAFAGDH